MSKKEYSKIDYSSQSNPFEVVITHAEIEWKLNFKHKSISGGVKHSMKVLIEGCRYACFDSSALEISSVSIGSESSLDDAEYTIDSAHPVLGSKIIVMIPKEYRSKDSIFSVYFKYKVCSNASAVQWLDAAATKGGKNPFVFTQCQAIHARSLLPCMDSPGVKFTYSATVRAPLWCTVLMSALESKKMKFNKTKKDFENLFSFHQPVAIPAYLIALAAGVLSTVEISSRVKIWSEPEVINDASFEFSQTEEFLSVAESLTCPYPWERYDVLCLPPSFPYGGMENPCLTFATPTLLAGDKSLADVIAHEIAHSWTGNLVTNHTWSHFWLNEGWTVWLERKIMAAFKNDNEVFKLSAQSGFKGLRNDVDRMGNDSGFTQLVWPLEDGQDPDDAFSRVPYEKGFNFLYYLENKVGNDLFLVFAKEYIQHFKFGTVTSGEFRDFFLEHFKNCPTVADIDWTEWFFGCGMPPNDPDFSNSLSESAEGLAALWLECDKQSNFSKISSIKNTMNSWSSSQICIFLEFLLSDVESNSLQRGLSEELLLKLDEMYNFSSRKNAEIKFRWQCLCLHSDVQWIVPHVVDFISSQGRMKFVRPLYRALRLSHSGADAAVECFSKFEHSYHPIAKKMIASDLKILNIASETEISNEEISQLEDTSINEEVKSNEEVVEDESLYHAHVDEVNQNAFSETILTNDTNINDMTTNQNEVFEAYVGEAANLATFESEESEIINDSSVAISTRQLDTQNDVNIPNNSFTDGNLNNSSSSTGNEDNSQVKTSKSSSGMHFVVTIAVVSAIAAFSIVYLRNKK